MEWESDREWYARKNIESSTCWTFKKKVSAGSHDIAVKVKPGEKEYIAISALVWQ